MRLLKIIISLYLLSCTHCAILSKYDSLTITSEEVIFESKDFDDDEDMHFKIKSDNFNFGKVYDDLFGNPYDVEYYYVILIEIKEETLNIIFISKSQKLKTTMI